MRSTSIKVINPNQIPRSALHRICTIHTSSDYRKDDFSSDPDRKHKKDGKNWIYKPCNFSSIREAGERIKNLMQIYVYARRKMNSRLTVTFDWARRGSTLWWNAEVEEERRETGWGKRMRRSNARVFQRDPSPTKSPRIREAQREGGTVSAGSAHYSSTATTSLYQRRGNGVMAAAYGQ